MIELSTQDARRVAVRAQLLGPQRPTDLLTVVRALTLLQHDQTRAVAPSADLVLWSRLGSGYAPDDLEDAIAAGHLVELRGMVRPVEDLPLHLVDPEIPPDVRDWLEDNEGCRLDLLQRLREDGPATARELPDTCVRPWHSSGWSHHKNVQRMLGFLERRAEVAVVGRRGSARLWDLAERVWDLPDVLPDPEQARQRRDRRWLQAMGIVRRTALARTGDVASAGEPCRLAGVGGTWRVDPDQLDQPWDGEDRARLLSPLDRLVFDRARARALFGFDYQLERYKPAAARRWGYWALPVLYGDRLVGKLDATADRSAGVLRVDGLHEDEPLSRSVRTAIEDEVDALADWLGLRPLRQR